MKLIYILMKQNRFDKFGLRDLFAKNIKPKKRKSKN